VLTDLFPSILEIVTKRISEVSGRRVRGALQLLAGRRQQLFDVGDPVTELTQDPVGRELAASVVTNGTQQNSSRHRLRQTGSLANSHCGYDEDDDDSRQRQHVGRSMMTLSDSRWTEECRLHLAIVYDESR